MEKQKTIGELVFAFMPENQTEKPFLVDAYTLVHDLEATVLQQEVEQLIIAQTLERVKLCLESIGFSLVLEEIAKSKV